MSYRFSLEIHANQERVATRALTSRNFTLAIEYFRFRAMRRGTIEPRLGGHPDAILTPIWGKEAGWVTAIQVDIPGDNTDGAKDEDTSASSNAIPLAYFAPLATQTIRGLTASTGNEVPAANDVSSKAASTKKFEYRLVAEPCSAEHVAPPTKNRAFVVEEVAQALPLEPGDLSELEGHSSSRRSNRDETVVDEMPVFIPRHVLDEAELQKNTRGRVETGGILLGHLRRDRASREIYLEVTTQIPAHHTEATSTKLTFTPETWAEAQQAIDRRNSREIVCGWWHSHPAREWCKDCSPEEWRRCPLATESFVSPEDQALTEACFPRAYSVALVLGDQVQEDLTWTTYHDLYGWDRGLLTKRDYFVIDAIHASFEGES